MGLLQHRGDQQQWPCVFCYPRGQTSWNRSLPGQNGCQVQQQPEKKKQLHLVFAFLCFLTLFSFSRGDHTFADSYLTVIPRGTEFVVFSIDGSFAASVSIMGSDPKVRAGAVDVVR